MSDEKTVLIYDSWASMILSLPPKMAGELVQEFLGYAFNKEANETENPALKAMLVMMVEKLNEDLYGEGENG